MPKKRIKLITHHYTYTEFEQNDGVSYIERTEKNQKHNYVIVMAVSKLVKRGTITCVWLIKKTCYTFGFALVYPFVLTKKAGQRLSADLSTFPKAAAERWERLTSREAKLALASFVLLSVALTVSFHGANLYANGLSIKGRVLGQATLGLNHIKKGGEFLKNKEVIPAEKEFSIAIANFQKSKEEIAKTGIILNTALSLLPAKRDAESLLEAGSLLSEAAIRFTRVYDAANGLTFTPQGFRGGQPNDELLKIITKNLHEGIEKSTQGYVLLQQIDTASLPPDLQNQFTTSKEVLGMALKSLEYIQDISVLAENLLLGNKHVLLLFQNNNELRATGGFPGTFGQLDIRNGSFDRLHVSSIYDLDGQLELGGKKIIPPYPLFSINDRWYLRDANWFTDFRQSARVINEFYQKESNKTADTIIVITPQVIVDLLKITGPVNMPAYGIVLDSDNFVELTQAETSVYYDRTQNKPKQMLADFMNIFLSRLTQVSNDELISVLHTLERNLYGKHIMLWTRNEQTQKDLEALNWAGQIHQTDKDYLLVSMSNLNGSKTDLYLENKISLETTITERGTILNTLTFTRKNPLPALDSMTNVSFIRFLVPQGSTLLSNQGFSYYKDLDVKYEADGNIHPDVSAWESSIVKDLATGTLIGKEAGKTFFGNWLEVKGGEEKTVRLTYELPFLIEDVDSFGILLQKQPGVENFPFMYTVKHAGRKVYWSSQKPEQSQSYAKTLPIVLDKDRFLGFVFEKE